MASVKVILRLKKKNKKGEAPLIVQIIHNRKTKEISLKRYIPIECWNKKTQRVIKHPEKESINILISSTISRISSTIDNKRALGEDFNIKEVLSEPKKINSEQRLIVEFLDDFIKTNPECLRYNTLKGYGVTLKKVKAFDSGVTFEVLDEDWLRAFKKFLIDTERNDTNTVHSRLKTIRKIMNIAVRKGWVKNYPFRHFRIETKSSERKSLTYDEILKIEELDLKGHTELVKDCFLFSCYTGLRFGDLIRLKKDNFISYKDTEKKPSIKLTLKMSKTKETISIKLNPKALLLYNKYKFIEGPYFFPILPVEAIGYTDKHISTKISSWNAYFNKILKDIAIKANLWPISMHVARHSFATIILNLGGRMEAVSKLLGHSNLKVTQIYAKLIDKEKDKAIDLWK